MTAPPQEPDRRRTPARARATAADVPAAPCAALRTVRRPAP
ncbi:hypothetical protein [Kocuria kalidii]